MINIALEVLNTFSLAIEYLLNKEISNCPYAHADRATKIINSLIIHLCVYLCPTIC